MVKVIKVVGMDSYIAEFTPENSDSVVEESETPSAPESEPENDSRSVKTTKKSTSK